MLELSLPKRPFSFLDAGCGNGWVVRLVKSMEDCLLSEGIDGSVKMIEKARETDRLNTYYREDLTKWSPNKKYDVIHSMEVFYYLEKPEELLAKIHDNWLGTSGRLVMGIDFYRENTVSHDWPEKCGINLMRLFSEKDWIQVFKKAGFEEVSARRIDAKEGWAGTLCVIGQKT
jgi:predicted TPR repeat methyltransferase